MTKTEFHKRLSKYGKVYRINYEVSEQTAYRRDNNKKDTFHTSKKIVGYLDVRLEKLQDFFGEFGKKAELEQCVASNFEMITRDILFHKSIYIQVTIQLPTKFSSRKTT